MGLRVALGDVGPARADGDDEFELEMQVRRGGGIGHVGPAGHDRIGRLGEEEGRLASRVSAHLARVFGIVAADAEDAPHREGSPARHGNGRDRRRRDDVIGHAKAPSRVVRALV